MERTKFDEADGGGEFRLIQGRLQSRDGTGFAQTGRKLESPLGQLLNPRNSRATSAKDDPGTQVIEQMRLHQFLSDQFEGLFEPQGHDAAQVLGPDLVSREEFVLRPGEKRPLEKKLSPETRFIGVMVAFRELERARWRAVIPVAANRTNIVAVSLDDIAVQATRTQPEIKP